MGIYDRDYYRNPPPSSAFGRMRMLSVNTWLIIINVAVFVVNNLVQQQIAEPDGTFMMYKPIEMMGYFSVTTAVFHLQVWRFITFQFLHAGFEHILFNMIALFFFGPIVERYLGSRRYLAFYLLCGIAGPLMYMVFWAVGYFDPNIPMVGASAGIYGVLIAGAILAPNATVLIYGIIPVKFRVFAWLLLAYALYTIFSHGANAGGQAAHIGGAILGFVLIKNPRLLNVFEWSGRRRMRYRQ